MVKNGATTKQIATINRVEPKTINFLLEGFMKLVPNAGPVVRQAMTVPAALVLHSNEMAWSLTLTALKLKKS